MESMRKLAVLSLLAVAACGDDDPVRHLDGGMTDSPMPMIDAPVIPQPVTLTITRDGLPQEGIVVYFQNSDSTLVASGMTDATGSVSQVMNAGGYVTAMDPYAAPSGLPPAYDVFTFAGVKPGDHLRLSDDNTFLSMTVTLPVETDPAISYYRVHSPCGETNVSGAGSGNTPSGPVYMNGCGTTTDIIVAAYDGNGAVLSYFFVPGQAVSDNGTLDFSAKTFVTGTSRTYTFTNVPNGNSIDISDHLFSTKGELLEVTGSVSGDPATGSLSVPTFTNAVSAVEGKLFDGMTMHGSFDWGPFAATYSIADYTARLLVGFTSAPSFDTTTHTIGWTESSGGAPDFVFAEADAYRQVDNREIHWQITAPYLAGSVAYPVVPAGSYDVNFTANDSVNVQLLGVAKIPGGYDAVRANVFLSQSPIGPVMSATGSAQYALNIANLGRTIKPQRWFKHRADLSEAALTTTRVLAPKRALTGRHR
jgi:hypothetical protein